MRGRFSRHSTCSHGLRIKYKLFYVLYRGDLGQFHICSFSGPIEVSAVEFGEGAFQQRLKHGDRGDQ